MGAQRYGRFQLNFTWMLTNTSIWTTQIFKKKLKRQSFIIFTFQKSAITFEQGCIWVLYQTCKDIRTCRAFEKDLQTNPFIISLGPSDAIWWQRFGSTSAQVMACCLTESSHYLNQSWLIISKVEWQSSKRKLTRDYSAINHWNCLGN